MENIINKIKVGDNLYDIQASSSSLVSITHGELLDLRSNGQLIPGTFYRITDYNCTIKPYFIYGSGGNTFAVANHPFDIIVRADSETRLNENASAIKHEGDTYFQNNDLQKWELKYSLYYYGFESNQYDWGDYTGTGLIYYMKDEFGNEAPYDFKNILFSRYQITNITSGNLPSSLRDDLKSYLGGDYGLFPGGYMKGNVNFITDTKPIWRYTFDYKGEDASINGYAYNNVIKPYIKDGVQSLNNGVINCLKDDKSFNNTIGYNCHDFTMLPGCYNCKCDNDCYGWISASYCSGWTCGSESSNWISSNNCFGWNCGSGCEDWVCGSESSLWSCGNNSSNWYVDPDCYNWTCGMCCLNWHCNGSCYSWSCGNDCSNWSIDNCCALSCGDYCNYWSIGEKISNINIDSGTNNIKITSYKDNIKVCSGNYNNSTININTGYSTVGIDSTDTVVIYNPADLVYSGGSGS